MLRLVLREPPPRQTKKEFAQVTTQHASNGEHPSAQSRDPQGYVVFCLHIAVFYATRFTAVAVAATCLPRPLVASSKPLTGAMPGGQVSFCLIYRTMRKGKAAAAS